MAVTYVIAYDIAQDTQRAKVSALLGHHGVRVQRSVFHCMLDQAALEPLWERLTTLVDPATDGLVAFVQCETCEQQLRQHGQTRVEEQPVCWIV